MKPLKQICYSALFCSVLAVPAGYAQKAKPALPETEQERMQRQLNEQVLAAPFSVEDTAKLDSYIKKAMEKNMKPVETAPPYWRPGYTCSSIYSYGWRAYGDCYYYHRYYGRYWY